MDKCIDKDGSAEAVASKKPRWNGQAQNTVSWAPASPLGKQVKCVPPVSYRNTAGTGGTAVTTADDQAVLEAESPYHKVRTFPVTFTFYDKTVLYLRWHLEAEYYT